MKRILKQKYGMRTYNVYLVSKQEDGCFEVILTEIFHKVAAERTLSVVNGKYKYDEGEVILWHIYTTSDYFAALAHKYQELIEEAIKNEISD